MWDLIPNIAHWVYSAFVRPILLYGVLVRWPVLSKKTYADTLEKIQRLAGLSVTGALRTTPTAALNTILGLPPLDLFARNVARKAALRLREAGFLQLRAYSHSRVGMADTVEADYLVPVNSGDRSTGMNFLRVSENEEEDGPHYDFRSSR